MTELAVIQNDLRATVDTREVTGLEAWARNAKLATDVARQLALTPFTPASLIAQETDDRGKPIGVDYERTVGNVLGALLVGDELGLAPMAALRSIDIIKGTPALRAVALRAIAQAAGHEMVLVESSETRAIVKGRRRGSTEWQQSVWTKDRAQKLGLVNRDQWRSQPTAMLIARATAECARLIASDAVLGLPYVAEELADGLVGIEEAQPELAAPEQPAKRTARRRTAQPAAVARPPIATTGGEPDPEPDFDEPAPTASAATDEDFGPAEPVTQAQLAKMHAQFGDLGVEDREAGLALIGAIVGRDVDSSKRLTKQEATQLIDELDRRLLAWQADPPKTTDEEPPA